MSINQLLLGLIIIIIILAFQYLREARRYYTNYYERIEGFEDNSTPVDKTFFNTINNLFNPTKPHPLTATEISQVSQAIQTTNQPYISSAYEKGTAGQRVQTGALYESSDALKKAQTICEIVVPGSGNKLDCNAFDNAQFNQFCGMSFDTGTDSKGNTHMGGLYIDPTLKASYPANGVYNPTFGTSNQFAINKATCQYMQNDIDCKNLTNPIGTKNCTQCFSDNSRHAVVDNVATAQPTFTFYTNATDMTLKVTETNTTYTLISSSSTIPVSSGVTKTSGPTANSIAFQTVFTGPVNITEGQNFTITANIASGAAVSLAGKLQGATHQGLYSIDINAMIDTDNGQIPSVGGDVNGCLQINQLYGTNKIMLHGLMTFTFVNPSAFDSVNCQNGPFITKASSLDYLDTNEPCYGSTASPGNYSDKCLQRMFTAVGGTTAGSGYPNTPEKVHTLNVDDFGKKRTLAEIGDFLYQKSVLAATGLNNGQTVPIDYWSSWSQYFTGNTITNPCQTTAPGQPVTADCQIYLFNQSGCGGTIRGTSPGTYNPDPNVKNCTNTAGNPIVCPPNPTVTAAAAAGNKDGIIAFYANAFQQTNDPTLSNQAKAASVLGCKGVNLLQ